MVLIRLQSLLLSVLLALLWFNETRCFQPYGRATHNKLRLFTARTYSKQKDDTDDDEATTRNLPFFASPINSINNNNIIINNNEDDKKISSFHNFNNESDGGGSAETTGSMDNLNLELNANNKNDDDDKEDSYDDVNVLYSLSNWTSNWNNGYSDNNDGYSPFLETSRSKKRQSQKLQRQQQERQKLRLLQRRSAATDNDDDNEDGYADMQRRKRSILKDLFKMPFQAIKETLSHTPKETGTLILVRHGESLWNANQTFTGWADPDLSDKGKREMEHAARLLLEGGYKIDVVFTSRLKRAIRSVWILLQELNEVYLPVFKSWRLNERMYGALTGLSKRETAEQLGHDLVQQWRGSLHARPPALTPKHSYWPGNDRKYADLSLEQIPLTESLKDCMERTVPVWERKIMWELQKGNNILVVGHANTLRGLVKTIDQIGDDEIQDVAIPTGIPIIYKFNTQLQPITPVSDERTATQVHMNGMFLERPGTFKEALKREDEWSMAVPGYDSTMARHNRPMTPLERSLYKLNAVRELGDWAKEFITVGDVAEEDDGNDGNMGKPIQLMEQDDVWERGIQELKKAEAKKASTSVVPTFYSQPCVKSVPQANVSGAIPVRSDSVIVIIRHGKTQHNKLGLFTGWEDVPLATEGIEEAKQAGRLLKKHGFEFDVVYTSWLSRALETAWYVMDEMDSLWLPIIKTWRLNERMYGGLTGLSKQMVKQRHGDVQFKAWRRGYNVRPPPVSSFSQHYPGNDLRYKKYLRDVRYSVRESVIRSIEKGEITLERKFPKSESLKDCMDRTIPYFAQRIVPDAIDQGKRVLISSSENAIRGLLMHLCEIPPEHITGLEIPNGLPLIFDVKSKCVKLLDDGTGRDPLKVYNFGNAAKYLFRPCENEDGSPDEECDIHFAPANDFILTNEDKATIESITRKPVSS